jgi:signal transduction histidine kinase
MRECGPVDILIEEDDPGDLMDTETGKRGFGREVKIQDAMFGGSIPFAEPSDVVRIYASLITARKQVELKSRELDQKLRFMASQLVKAQEWERERISRDLHDDLGQSLIVLKLQFQAIARTMPSDLPGLRKDMDNGINYIDAILENVRRIAKDLRPSILDDLGLSVALKNLFNNFRRYYDAEVSYKMDDLNDLFSSERNLLIYRIFQEALTNIAKYAQATKVSINIKLREVEAVFTIMDNGKGFDVNRVLAGDTSTGGLGLSFMQERVNMLGGFLEIWSHQGQGTRLSLIVPFNP